MKFRKKIIHWLTSGSYLSKEAALIYLLGLLAPTVAAFCFILIRYRPNGTSRDKDIYDLIFILVGLMIGYLAFRARESHHIRRQMDDFHTKIQKDLAEMRDLQVYGSIISSDDIYARKTECIQDCIADKSLSKLPYAISLTSYIKDSPRDSHVDAVHDYHDALEDYILGGASVRRLIVIESRRKLGWAKDLLLKLKNTKYSMRLCTDYVTSQSLPPLSINIYGREHLFISYISTTTDSRPVHIYFRSPRIIELFRLYYDAIWSRGSDLITPKTDISEGSWNQRLFTELERKIKTAETSNENQIPPPTEQEGADPP